MWWMLIGIPFSALIFLCWISIGNLVFDFLSLDKALVRFGKENECGVSDGIMELLQFVMKSVYVILWPWPLFSITVQRCIGECVEE